MGKRGPMSPAQKAAISAGLKRYWAAKKGSGGSSSGSSGGHKIINIDTGKAISREEAAIRMFGSAGARKKLAAGKKAKKR